jgi:hypothetical protein
VVVNLIGATTTKTGLSVKSELDTNQYPAGRTVSDDELSTLHLRQDAFHGEWNYRWYPASGCSEMQTLLPEVRVIAGARSAA